MTNETKIREILHKMRGAVSVADGFIQNSEPDSEDTALHKEIAEKSMAKLADAIEELDSLVKQSK